METFGALRAISELTSEQWGLVTSAQAVDRGVSRAQLLRMAAAGLLERVQHGVYRLTGAPREENEHLCALWMGLDASAAPEGRALWPSDGAVVFGGVVAASLHEVGDLTVHEYELVTPVRRQSRQASVRFRVEQLSDTEVTTVRGLPVLTIPRLVRDLVQGTYPVDLSLVGDLVVDALRDGKTSTFELDTVYETFDPTTRAALEGYVQEQLRTPQYV